MVFAESLLLELLSRFCHGIRAFISDLGMAPRSTTRLSSPATSWRRALRKAVPLLLMTVTQPSRSAFLSSRATVRT